MTMLQLCISIQADKIENNNSFMSFLRSPQFQKILKKTVGESIYNTFLKRKTARENEKLALEQNPQPWERFLRKPSYWQRTQDWLYGKSRGHIGKKIGTIADYYDFPDTKEGKRAHLLQLLYNEDPVNYKNQWLNENQWNLLTENKKTKSFLQEANNNTLPRFGEFWLQTPSLPVQKGQTLKAPQKNPMLESK